jgi:predicted RNase H-like HicB family nuclease
MNTPMQPDPPRHAVAYARADSRRRRDYEIRIWYSAEKGDECFIAQVVEWPGIMAHGETREEAARQIQLALEGALEVAAGKGIKPPAPALAHAS